MKITVYDTYAFSENEGDRIIMESCLSVIRSICPEHSLIQIPTHVRLSSDAIRSAKGANLSFLCGTNIFNKRWRNRARKNQWAINRWQQLSINPVVSLGVGWNSYKTGSGFLSSMVYRRLLCKKRIHSVRDEFSKRNLEKIGVKRIVNTGCPTMWNLTAEHVESIPKIKSDSVVFTLTDYCQDPDRDRQLIALLLQKYENVIFWPQGSRDLEYLQSLGTYDGVNIIPAGLDSLDSQLGQDVDFVGTRLHAGIRALQRKRRTIILAVDNRATEMGRDFSLPIVQRGNLPDLKHMICEQWSTRIKIPEDAIAEWRNQFH